jgi:hypothetical protein
MTESQAERYADDIEQVIREDYDDDAGTLTWQELKDSCDANAYFEAVYADHGVEGAQQVLEIVEARFGR